MAEDDAKMEVGEDSGQKTDIAALKQAAKVTVEKKKKNGNVNGAVENGDDGMVNGSSEDEEDATDNDKKNAGSSKKRVPDNGQVKRADGEGKDAPTENGTKDKKSSAKGGSSGEDVEMVEDASEKKSDLKTPEKKKKSNSEEVTES